MLPGKYKARQDEVVMVAPEVAKSLGRGAGAESLRGRGGFRCG